MKIRSGFVSNSSSSSFIFVGFPKSEINDSTVLPKDEVTQKISKRDIDRFAMSHFTNDEEYVSYQNGNADDEFWNAARKHFASNLGDYDSPEGYSVHCVWNGDRSVPWLGIDVICVSGTGMTEVDSSEITKAQKKIKKDYPKAKSRIVLGSSC